MFCSDEESQEQIPGTHWCCRSQASPCHQSPLTPMGLRHPLPPDTSSCIDFGNLEREHSLSLLPPSCAPGVAKLLLGGEAAARTPCEIQTRLGGIQGAAQDSPSRAGQV